MKLSTPRITPVPIDSLNPEQREELKPFIDANVYNIMGTFARHKEALHKFLPWGSYILGDSSTLSAHDRELLILRTAWLTQSRYEWEQHVRIARQIGMDDKAFEHIKCGSQAPCLSKREILLLQAAEELHDDFHVSDVTWQGLSEHYDTRQLMDIVFTVGQYTLVAMALNSFGVQLDEEK